MDVLRDAIWQFAGAILALLALTVTIYVAWKQRQTKRLVCVRRHTRLLSVDATIQDRVQVSFRDQPVRDVSLVELQFLNAGSVPIDKRDFATGISASFGTRATILTVEIQESSPRDLGASLSVAIGPDNTDLTIEPVLLNVGDTFNVKCLVSSFSGVAFLARISGIKQIESHEPAVINQRTWRLRPWQMVLSVVMFITWLFLLGRPFDELVGASALFVALLSFTQFVREKAV